MNPRNPIPFILLLAFSAWSSVLAQGGNPRFKIEADVIGGLSGESNSTRFSNFGVNEPISGLSLKNLPDIENFAGFAGQIVALDQDMDGLPDYQEIALGTDKTKSDTDGDGLTDKEEVDSGTNPLLADTDGDGYSDMAEINANTNPLLSSSNPNQAPTDLNTTAPLILAENQPVGTVVGEFNGTDPDANSTLVYFLASGNGDHNNSLFSLDTNGTLTSQVVFDFESNASAYSLLVGVKDEYNASLEKSFTVSLTNVNEDLDGDGIEDAIDPDIDGDGFSNTVEMAYGSDPLDFNSRANQSPTNLELNGNTISENQAMGTEIGLFSALDTDTHAVLSFTFLNGSGESNNSLFTLEQNGTLTSAVIFDYESTASPLTIYVRASDEYNASTEGNFTINLTNVFEDFDGDGIEDAIDPDTDGDGFSNTVEMAQGTDPLDPASIPNALPFFEHNQSLSIAENLPVGTVIAQLLGSDPDGHSLTYKLAGGLPTSPGLSTVGHNAYGHTLFVGSGGGLWAKGSNYYGQIGDGTNESKSEPALIIEKGVVAVDISQAHSLFLQDDDSLWVMGSNSHGQLGDGTATDRSSTIKVDDNVAIISAGSEHSMYVKKDGSLWVMGRNWYGELGTGKNGNDGNWQNYYNSFKEDFDESEPIKIDDNVISISAGDIHSLYVKADGSLWSMGLNDRGQLGDGTLSNRNSPVKVLDSDVHIVSAGAQISAFVKSDGSLWKLGSSIVKIDDDVIAMSCGYDDVFYVKSDHTLWNIGFNLTETGGGENDFTEDLNATPTLLDDNVLFVSADNSFEGEEVLYQKKDGTVWTQTKPYVEWPAIPSWQGASKTQIQFSGAGGISPKSFELTLQGVLTSSRIFDHESEPTITFDALIQDELGGSTRKTFTVTVTNDIWDDPEVIAQMDDDQDGLSNGQEDSLGTDRNNPDTDGDGWLDGAEFAAKSNPLVADSDADGLNDFQEYNLGTNPLLSDTDGDGYNDKDEIIAGTLPEDRLDYPGAPDIRGDSTTIYDSPDGRRYEIHDLKRGKLWHRALSFATKLGGSLPQVEGNQALLTYLKNLMETNGVETESESLGLIGAWVGTADGSTVMLDMDGDLYVGDADENDQLAVVVAFEKPLVLHPAVLTINPEVNGEDVQAKGEILDTGGEIPFRVGFRISEKIMINNSDSTARIISGVQEQNFFRADIERLTPGKRYYIRAFAENSAGLQYGSVKRIKVEKIYTAPFNGKPLTDHWYQSDWFGAFKHANAEWIYHEKLGWLYHGPVGQNGIWFWSEKMKWSWTREDLWPYLWLNNEGTWVYFFGTNNGSPLFWNYNTKSYIQW